MPIEPTMADTLPIDAHSGNGAPVHIEVKSPKVILCSISYFNTVSSDVGGRPRCDSGERRMGVMLCYGET